MTPVKVKDIVGAFLRRQQYGFYFIEVNREREILQQKKHTLEQNIIMLESKLQTLVAHENFNQKYQARLQTRALKHWQQICEIKEGFEKHNMQNGSYAKIILDDVKAIFNKRIEKITYLESNICSFSLELDELMKNLAENYQELDIVNHQLEQYVNPPSNHKVSSKVNCIEVITEEELTTLASSIAYPEGALSNPRFTNY